MLNNANHRIVCESEDGIVAYLYNEMRTEDRCKFERHLVDCEACTDEFAGISNARFSVFEWQKLEFAEMATPEIVIPYHSADRLSKLTVKPSLGFLAGWREWLSLTPWSAAAGAFGAIVIMLGSGVFVFNFIGGNDQPTALHDVERENTQETVTTRISSEDLRQSSPKSDIDTPTLSEKPLNNGNALRTRQNNNGGQVVIQAAVPDKALRSKMPSRQVEANNRPVNSERVRPNVRQTLPSLSSEADDKDTTLRLSDLVADIDPIG